MSAFQSAMDILDTVKLADCFDEAVSLDAVTWKKVSVDHFQKKIFPKKVRVDRFYFSSWK
jgi:hypothetical protein